MPRLLVEIPSIDTERDYTIGEEVRIGKGRRRDSSGKETWHAEVVAKGREAHERVRSEPGDASTVVGGLPPIEQRGDGQYVRRVVLELRSSERDRLKRVTEGYLRVEDAYSGYTIGNEVLKAFDIKDPS